MKSKGLNDMLPRLAFQFGILLIAFAVVSQAIASDTVNAVSQFPPTVEKFFITPLKMSGRNNALLEVTYKEKLGRKVRINPDERKIELRDDGKGGDKQAGDGTYSAIIDFDFIGLQEQLVSPPKGLR